jgi:hypothetical protein
MDFLTGKIKPMYFKYLTAAFGSADFVHLWRGGYGCGGTISGTGRNGSFGDCQSRLEYYFIEAIAQLWGFDSDTGGCFEKGFGTKWNCI